MFDIGMGELVIIGVIALIAIGPKQLPEVARVVGRFFNELKRTASDLSLTITEARDSTDRTFADTKKSVAEVLNERAKNNITEDIAAKEANAASHTPVTDQPETPEKKEKPDNDK